MADEFKYDVIAELGDIRSPEDGKGWATRVKIISWNGGEPKVDIRQWKADNSRMGKGVSIHPDDIEPLIKILTKYLEEDSLEE